MIDAIIVYLMYKYTTGLNTQAFALFGVAFGLFAWEMTSMPMQYVVFLQTLTIRKKSMSQ